MSFDGIDPNTIVGWLAVLGVTFGALWKVGKWIILLRQDIERAISMLDTNQKMLTRHDRIILYILGHLGLSIAGEDREMMEAEKK